MRCFASRLNEVIILYGSILEIRTKIFLKFLLYINIVIIGHTILQNLVQFLVLLCFRLSLL